MILIDSHQPVVLVLLERTWNHMSFQISASKILELSTLTSKDMWHHRAWFVDSHFHLVLLGKENCTKPKRLTNVITHRFSKGFSFNNHLFFSKNSFGFTTTQTNYHGSWWTKIPMSSKKSDADFRKDTGAKSMNGTSVHLAGSLNQSTNKKNLTENLLFVGCFTSQTQKDIITQLVFQFVVFFLKGFFNN